MNWEAVGAVGELVGAVGVIVTVAYLALQVRQNTRAIEGSTVQSLMTLEKDIFSLIADHANVYRRGCDDFSDLDNDEAVQFTYIIAAEMSLVYNAYGQFQRNLISAEDWEAYKDGTLKRLAETGYGDAWALLEADYPKSFRDAFMVRRIEPNPGIEA